jgi:hypothetical protein
MCASLSEGGTGRIVADRDDDRYVRLRTYLSSPTRYIHTSVPGDTFYRWLLRSLE